jgi:hypothetical protein
MVRILTRSDVLSLISMPKVIEVIEQAHADLARGLAAMPDREPAAPPQTDSLLIPMTAALSRHGVGGVKLLADVPGNPSRGRPRQPSRGPGGGAPSQFWETANWGLRRYTELSWIDAVRWWCRRCGLCPDPL